MPQGLRRGLQAIGCEPCFGKDVALDIGGARHLRWFLLQWPEAALQ